MSNPEATNHAAVILASLDAFQKGRLDSSWDDARAALDALLAERNAAVKERLADQQKIAVSDQYLQRALAAEASLTRYRNALEQIRRMIWTKASDIAGAALDGPKEEQT